MTLTVGIIPTDSSFNCESIESEIECPFNEMFGFEIWRLTVWGHKVIKDLGCDLVYSLQNENIYVFDKEVIKLKNEFHKIIDNIDLVSKETKTEKSAIEFRIGNGLEAIRIAEKYLDKVGVSIA